MHIEGLFDSVSMEPHLPEKRQYTKLASFPGLPCFLLNANQRTKNGGGLGTRLIQSHSLCSTYFSEYLISYTGVTRRWCVCLPNLVKLTNLLRNKHRLNQTNLFLEVEIELPRTGLIFVIQIGHLDQHR